MQPPGDRIGHLLSDDLERLFRQCRMKLVVGQQFDAAAEIFLQHAHLKVRSRLLCGADLIEGALKGHAVETLAAVGEKLIKHRWQAFLSLGNFEFRPIPDVT